MGYINKCRTVNGGVIIGVPSKLVNSVEVLSHHSHNPHCDIVCYYYYDNDLCAKVEVTACKDLHSGIFTHEVYFFHGREELKHYTSRIYPHRMKMPKKYLEIAETLIKIHNKINFDNYVNRPN